MQTNPTDIVVAGAAAITLVSLIAALPTHPTYQIDNDEGHDLAQEERNFHKQVAINRAAFKKGIV